MSASASAEVVALCRAQLEAILGGKADPFGRAWDTEINGEERQFWCRAAGLGGYAWGYAGRAWGEINATHRTQIKTAVHKVARRAALLLNDKIGGASASVAS